MSIEEAAGFVAAAYAVILVVLVFSYVLSARRVAALKRDIELLEKELESRDPGGEDGSDRPASTKDRR
jgi:hypothetical protein